jgi:hypothetical protein
MQTITKNYKKKIIRIRILIILKIYVYNRKKREGEKKVEEISKKSSEKLKFK